MNYFIKQIFILFILILFSCELNHSFLNTESYAVNGILNLNSWDKNGIIALNGKWEFYYMQLLEPQDFKKNPVLTGYINVPSFIDKTRMGNKILSGKGYGTYRIKILLNNLSNLYSISIPLCETAYKLYVNGVLLAKSGIVGTNEFDAIPQYQYKIAAFKSEEKQVEIIIQVSNFNLVGGGLIKSPLFGINNEMIKIREKEVAFILFLTGSLIIMGLYHIVLFLPRRKDKSMLCLGFVCFIVALFALTNGNDFILTIIPIINWEIFIKLQYWSDFMGITIFMLFIYLLYPDKIFKKILIITAIVFSFYYLLILFTPAKIFSQLEFTYHYLSIIASVLILSFIFIESKRKMPGTLLILIGTSFLFISVLNDVLVSQQIIHTFYILPVGLFLFILMQSVILSIRFANALSRAESITGENGNSHKYERSSLTKEEAGKLLKTLEEFMMINKPYLDPELTLPDLAGMIKVNRNHLSQVINLELNENFNDYINKFRVEEIKKYFTDQDKQNLKILALAYDAGFNSKASFNTIFKKVTGITPSEYRKNLKTIQ